MKIYYRWTACLAISLASATLVFAQPKSAIQSNKVSAVMAPIPVPATNSPKPVSYSAPVLDANATTGSADILQVETNAPSTALLKQLQEQASADKSQFGGTNELTVQLSQLEPTGQVVERYVRVPGGQGGEPKLIRCLVPVFRIKK